MVKTAASTRVKWNVSSRGWPQIEERLYIAGQALKEVYPAAVQTVII